MIKAEIVADSISEAGARITTFLLVYPRFIHSELMTHRAFSRNAASSRAIPFKKMVKMIQENVAMPIHWGAEQKGMQSGGEVENKQGAILKWNRACRLAILSANQLAKLNVHKSICNRLLEPFAHMTTLVTATELNNFFNLRAHKDAMPEFQELAYLMLDLYVQNEPRVRKGKQWHLPYANKYLPENLPIELLLKISTARAARTSYLTMDGEIAHEKDYELHDRLSSSGHWSPFEHPALPLENPKEICGNFIGWMPYRKQFPNENQSILKSIPRCKQNAAK